MIKVLLHEDYKFALFVPDIIDMWDKDGADDFIFFLYPIRRIVNRLYVNLLSRLWEIIIAMNDTSFRRYFVVILSKKMQNSSAVKNNSVTLSTIRIAVIDDNSLYLSTIRMT